MKKNAELVKSVRPARGLATLLLVLTLIAALAGGYYYYQKYFGQSDDQRVAVFTTNGQVYFGYLFSANSRVLGLKDIYYLKTEDLKASEDGTKTISLIKMGNELHGPIDEIFINQSQVFFYQHLKDESKINSAIGKFLAK
jgi:hypothetical protein